MTPILDGMTFPATARPKAKAGGRRHRVTRIEAQLLAAVEELFQEFDQLPVLEVIEAFNAARWSLSSPGAHPDTAAIADIARAKLSAAA